MRPYAIILKPESAFGTPLKGDTIFGQFCWQAAETPELLNGGFERWIAAYHVHPFAVFSSAWPVVCGKNGAVNYALRRPELPPFLLGDPDCVKSCEERLVRRKENKTRKWLLVSEDLKINFSWDNILSDRELHSRISATFSANEKRRLQNTESRVSLQAEQQHNTINRLTMTTGTGMFAPYAMENTWHLPGLELVVFVAVNEEACTIEQITTGLSRMGEWGFGRDASTGLGRFSLGEIDELEWPQPTPGSALLTLGPCVPEPGRYEEIFFAPFTRFGRHGAQLMHTGKPFKNPIVMADEGAVLVPKPGEVSPRPFIGRAITNISKAMRSAVAQGYTLVLPFTMPNSN